ncbi:MAG: hypothetical protein ACI4QA_05885 [Candidatus Spyradosoma sp.]
MYIFKFVKIRVDSWLRTFSSASLDEQAALFPAFPKKWLYTRADKSDTYASILNQPSTQMGNLKKKRRLKMNKHKRRKRSKANRHKKRLWG